MHPETAKKVHALWVAHSIMWEREAAVEAAIDRILEIYFDKAQALEVVGESEVAKLVASEWGVQEEP